MRLNHRVYPARLLALVLVRVARVALPVLVQVQVVLVQAVLQVLARVRVAQAPQVR